MTTENARDRGYAIRERLKAATKTATQIEKAIDDAKFEEIGLILKALQSQLTVVTHSVNDFQDTYNTEYIGGNE